MFSKVFCLFAKKLISEISSPTKGHLYIVHQRTNFKEEKKKTEVKKK